MFFFSLYYLFAALLRETQTTEKNQNQTIHISFIIHCKFFYLLFISECLGQQQQPPDTNENRYEE